MLKTFRAYSLYFAWLIAVLGLLISLYSSEVLKMTVCHLCWYQRICLYPLALMLGIAAFYNDKRIIRYALPLSVLGFLFAVYHYLLQMVPALAPIELCGRGPSCATIDFNVFGFITYPFLSGVAFLFISLLLLISRFNVKN